MTGASSSAETTLVDHLRGELRDLNDVIRGLRVKLAEQRALVETYEARVRVSVARQAVADELRRLVQAHIDGEPGLSEKLFDLAVAIEAGLSLPPDQLL